jgi:hypothetical protein
MGISTDPATGAPRITLAWRTDAHVSVPLYPFTAAQSEKLTSTAAGQWWRRRHCTVAVL